jgi:hypothetical protein
MRTQATAAQHAGQASAAILEFQGVKSLLELLDAVVLMLDQALDFVEGRHDGSLIRPRGRCV